MMDPDSMQRAGVLVAAFVGGWTHSFVRDLGATRRFRRYALDAARDAVRLHEQTCARLHEETE